MLRAPLRKFQSLPCCHIFLSNFARMFLLVCVNSKLHHHVHKNPQQDTDLSWLNPLRSLQPFLFNLLSQRITLLLQKLVISYLINKFFACCGIWRLICIGSTGARSCPFRVKSRKSQETSVRIIEIELVTSLSTIRCTLSVSVSVGVDLSTGVLECETVCC